MSKYSSYRLSNYATGDGSAIDTNGILRTNALSVQEALNEQLFLIAINSDSVANPGTFNLCLEEVGYKLSNQSQVKIVTN